MAWLEPSDLDASERLRWFAGVPIATNPLILMDLVRLLVILCCTAFVLLLCAQQFLGNGLNEHKIIAALWLAIYLGCTVAVAFFMISIVVFRNMYITYFNFAPHAIIYENIKAPTTAKRHFFSIRAYAVASPKNIKRSIRREVAWKNFTVWQALPEIRTILLQGKGIATLRVYCPDSVAYDQAIVYIKSKFNELNTKE